MALVLILTKKGGDYRVKRKIDYQSTLFVGIDIGSKINVVSAINFEIEFLIKMMPVPNAKGGAETIEGLLYKAVSGSDRYHHIIVGLESTGFYGVHLANYLSTSSILAPYDILVFCINPLHIAAYKKTFTDIGKNDRIDSYVIADFARAGKITTEPWKGSQYLALQRLTRHRLHITDCIVREKVYMLNNVFLKFSALAFSDNETCPFSDTFGATSEAVLTQFMSVEDIVNTPIEELASFIASKSRNRIADPKETAQLLQTAARNSYRLDKCLYEPLTISISCSFNCIRAFEKELKAIDHAILETVKGLNPLEYTILTSIPGIGHVYAAGILAEIGTIQCFPSHSKLAKYAGIVWNDNDSGDFQAEDSHLSKAGNAYLRYYLIEATGSVINHVPEYKKYYDKKYAEATIHQHKRALALTSRKFIRLLYGLLANNKLYSPGQGRG